MKKIDKYFDANKKLWNERVNIHFESEFYDNKKFIKTKNSLNSIELEELGNIKNKSILHLQCHFGQDTISLANLGAKVTGIDFSENAIEKAKELSNIVNIKADFICSNIYDLKKSLNRKFDIVFTSYGTIGWLPDINNWAEIVSYFLKRNGKFIIAEFHPYIWMFSNNFKEIKYSYFHTSAPIKEVIKGTYADRNSDVKLVEYGWNHSLSDVINSLISHGLKIESLKEFPYSPYNCFSNLIESKKGKFVFKDFPNLIPMVYSLKAKKI
ncbi:MAG: class I SAM-dependent methyltransferase [Ignavibacteriales bacterium]|nr:class I SAM-dependent methyltransferase [Ignavibacteriales bacterium]MCB9219600.1 class I SAM-dependent methyltransferase [Ignavibacteriales bacterium]MCB9257796.1 class I SAM-dependent methyltransferase [Ignavibacteriales bacterium]